MKINTKIKYNSSKIQLVCLGMFLLLGLFVGFGAQASEITSAKVIELVNAARAEDGENALRENAQLTMAATEKMNDMFQNDYFNHNSPGGVTPWHWIDESGYDYHFAGENLAINFTEAEAQQKAWMQSPSHRKNILNSNYSEIGVAVKQGNINGQASIVTVQMFGLKAGEAVPNGAVSTQNQKGLVLAAGIVRNVKNLDVKHVWIFIGVILLLALLADLVYLAQEKHHKMLLIHHK